MNSLMDLRTVVVTVTTRTWNRQIKLKMAEEQEKQTSPQEEPPRGPVRDRRPPRALTSNTLGQPSYQP